MDSRSLLALFAIVLFAAVVNAAPSEDVDEVIDEDLERGFKEQVKNVAKVLAKKTLKYYKYMGNAKRVNWGCVKEVIDHCEIYPVFRTHRYLKCAKNYVFIEHKDHCYPMAE